MKRAKNLLVAAAVLVMLPWLALGQTEGPPSQQPGNGLREDGIGLAPARFELPILPGTERTVIVNIIYNSVSAEAQPTRLVAYLGDWDILKDGEAEYYKAGTRPNTACPWIIYSPGEVTAMPGKIHPLRVTISVPKDATPGDHLAALFVESRPDNIRLDQNRRQVILRFRMAALFYIMVPELTRKGSLQNLKSEANDNGILVTPTLKNEGNSHIRPVHSIKVLDSKNAVVAEMAERESLPILGGYELSRALLIEKPLRSGTYSVIYRIDFKDGSPIIEGQTELTLKDRPARKSDSAQ